MAKTYHDPAKQKAREKFLEFIRKNLHKKPEDTKVVCFPGPEAIEIFQVYDKLGIPRQNITGLERDATAFQALKDKNLGINLEHTVDEAFFRTRDATFDIISLDYCGPLTMHITATIGEISGRHRLANHGILLTNILGAREVKYVSDAMKSTAAFKQLLARQEDGNIGVGSPRKYLELLSDQSDHIDFDERVRDNAITTAVKSMLLFGIINVDDSPVFKCGRDYPALQAKMGELLEQKSHEDIAFRKMHECFQRKHFSHVMPYSLVHSQLFFDNLKSLGLSVLFGAYLAWVFHDGYVPEKIERYRYVSNSFSPMMTDLWQVRDAKEALALPPYIVRVEITPEQKVRIELANRTINQPIEYFNPLTQKEINRAMKKCERLFEQCGEPGFEIPFPERINLGSASDYVVKDEILEAEAEAFLKEGCSPQEILDCFRGVSRKRIFELYKGLEADAKLS